MNLLKINGNAWYGWQMLPGYGDEYSPYYSPIFIENVVPLKTGQGLLQLDYFDPLYAEGVQDFSRVLCVIDHQADYLIARLHGEDQRSAVVSKIGFDWIKTTLPELERALAPVFTKKATWADCQEYLNAAFPEISRSVEAKNNRRSG